VIVCGLLAALSSGAEPAVTGKTTTGAPPAMAGQTKTLPDLVPAASLPIMRPTGVPAAPHAGALLAAASQAASCDAVLATKWPGKTLDTLPPGQKKKLLAECKEGDSSGKGTGPAPMAATTPGTCSGSAPACATDSAMHVSWGDLTLTSGVTVTIEATNLAGIRRQGGAPLSTPDTRLYLVRCTSSDGRCTKGDVVAVDDDGGSGYASKIVFNPTRLGAYHWILMDYEAGNEGFADLEITANGQSTTTLSHLFFAGYHSVREIHANDWLFVGKNPNGQGFSEYPEYHDSTLFAFSHSGRDCYNGACGTFWFDDDVQVGGNAQSIYLSRLQIDEAIDSARVIVGVYGGVWAEYMCDDLASPAPKRERSRQQVIFGLG